MIGRRFERLVWDIVDCIVIYGCGGRASLEALTAQYNLEQGNEAGSNTFTNLADGRNFGIV